MNNFKQNKLTLGLMTVLLSLIFVASSNKAEAQYCGFDYVQYWNQYAVINSVTVTDITEGTDVISRLNSGWDQWATVDETGGPYDINIGNNFEIKINHGVYYYGYLRAFVDKNLDQRFENAPMGPDEEFLASIYVSAGFVIPPTQTYIMQSATGPASVNTSEGTFLPSKGGEYKVNVKLTKLSGKSAQGVNVFTVANNYDMSVASVESPRTSRFPRFFKYLRLTNIKVAALVQNTGLNPVNRFEVTAKIYNANTNVLVSNQPKVVYDSDNDPNLEPLQSGQKYEANFAAFQTAFTGEYYVQFEVTYTYDEEEYNNFLPRPDGEKHYFEVQYNDQLSAGEFKDPIAGSVLKVNKPTSPIIEFLNNGISDASNINFHMVVKNEAGVEVYNEVSFLEDLPQGRYNKKLVTYPNMIIREPGTYTACAWVDYPYDTKKDDDTTCITFEVELGIQDTITVGDLNDIVNDTANDDELNSANDENESQRIESSVIDFNFNGFSVNPASTTTAIKFNSSEALTLEVVDMNGNIVLTDVAKDGLYNLNVSNLANGAYTVLLRSANGIQSRQLSVVR
jgi:hypothetical protein